MNTDLRTIHDHPANTVELVEAALEQIRPALMADGADVQLVSIKDGVVLLKLLGACSGCPYSETTLKEGIERFLTSDVPEIQSVETISART